MFWQKIRKRGILLTVIIFVISGNSYLFSQDKYLLKQSSSFRNKYNVSDTAINKKKDSIYKEIHPQDASDETGFFVFNKDTTASLRIFASIRIFGAYDFNGLKGGTSFSLSSIPIGSDTKNENSFFLSANLTKFGLEAKFKKIIGLLMKIEADFNSTNKNLRIRHAFGMSKFLLVGQTWSIFSDVASIPTTVDTDGPPTAVSTRTVQVKYFNIFKNWFYSVGVESPNPTVEIPDSLLLEPVSQSFPDFAGKTGLTGKWGRLQLAAILRSITVRNFDGSLAVKSGYGILLSDLFKLGKGFEIMSQALYGAGISSLMNLSGSSATDVILNPSTGNYELNTSYGGFVSFSKSFLHQNNLILTLTYGQVNIVEEDIQPDDYFSRGQYLTASMFWNTDLGFRIGLEYELGYARNKNGESGNANRLAFTTYYDF